MSVADRAERGFHRALDLTGRLVRLRRTVAATGAYDPATGNVLSTQPEEIATPAIVADETYRLEGGAVARRRVASIPARLIERYFGRSPWGEFPWTGEIPMVPEVGDFVVEGSGEPQRVISADPTVVGGRAIFFRLNLAGGAA